MIFLLFILNLVISAFNAWGCGKTWTSTRARGGSAHFMNWMGAVMSAVGFTWCYLLLVGLGAANIPITNDETGVSAPLVSAEQLEVFFSLGYLAIVFPMLGSGLAITIYSWREFARSRSVGGGLIAGWNTFAQVSNMYHALEGVPNAFGKVAGFFDGDKKDGKVVVILLALFAILAGFLTTFAIIRWSAKNALMAESFARRELP